MGEMGVNNPVEKAGAAIATSRACTDVIVTGTKGYREISDHMSQAKKEMSHVVK